jgi:ATP/maltotriose-dependent transcriptional regulator MalT
MIPSGSSDFTLAGMAVASSRHFVGRAEELARLLAALERAKRGRPQLVLLTGEAGVGKTRLLVEVAGRVQQRGVRVLTGGCVELGDIGLPYLPVVDALRGIADNPSDAELLTEVAATAPGLGRLLPGIQQAGQVGRFAGDGLDQLQVLDAVRAVLVRCAERSPVILVLEDLHWADRASRDLVAFLARTLRSGRVMLVASYRSDELHPRHPLRPLLAELVRLPGVERLELAPFSRMELADYLEAIRGKPLAPDQVARIYARSEGNPFYAEQLLAADSGEAHGGLPSTLADVLLARVQGLSEPAQQVLRVVAVAGRGVSHGLLTQVAGWPEADLEQGLRDAVGSGVLVTNSRSGGYAFRHALLQESVYGDLLPGEQVRLHATYARVLASTEGAAAELAYHCVQSHDLAGALVASVRAAAEAEAVAAPAETLRHLEQALSLWERVSDAATVTGADRTDLLLQAAAAGSDAGNRERAIALTQEAVERIDPGAKPLQAAAAFERLGHYIIDMHRQAFGKALEACTRAAELAPAHPPTQLRARISSTIAKVLKDAGRYEEARHWCEEACAVARAVGSADEEAEALAVLAMLEEREGHLNKARRLYAKALNRATDTRDARVRLTVTFDRAYSNKLRGELVEALGLLDEGVNRAWQAGLAWSQPGVMLRGWQCRIHYMLGNWDESERLAATFDVVAATPAHVRLSVLALPVEVGRGHKRAAERLKWIRMLGADLSVLVGVASYGAELACWQGDLDAARESIQGALRAYRRVGSHATVPMVMLCPFGLAAEADRAERARAAGAADQVADARNVGLALLQEGRAAACGTLEFGKLQDLTKLKAAMVKAEAEWTRLGGRSDPDAWRAAVAAFSFGHDYEVACCQWRLAEALIHVGDRKQATAAAQAAYKTAKDLRAEPLRAAVGALARRARLDLDRGVPHESRRSGLTDRECEVLGLLVAGKTDRQIAEHLFISKKTAGVHVTNIFAKLGVHNRRDAATRTRELGLTGSTEGF